MSQMISLKSGDKMKSSNRNMPSMSMKKRISPIRLSRSPRPTSSIMKRVTSPIGKRLDMPNKMMRPTRPQSRSRSPPHSNVLRSAIQAPSLPVDRSHNPRRDKFEKERKSPTPLARKPMLPTSSVSQKLVKDGYNQSRPSDRSPQYVPAKRKMARSPEKYPQSRSPTFKNKDLRSPDYRLNRKSDVGHSSSASYMFSISPEKALPSYDMHSRGALSKPAARKSPPKMIPSSQKHIYEASAESRYKVSGDPYGNNSKSEFIPTLSERLSSTYTHEMDSQRPAYSLEDLEKIKISVQPKRKSSPTIRRIVNPNDVKPSRRPDEGRWPMFEREEIKHHPHDLREDSHYEKKLNLSGGFYNSMQAKGLREIENYEITRHKFDTGILSTSRRTLNDRWSHVELKKLATEKDERSIEYQPQIKRDLSDLRRSHSSDRDFRFARGRNSSRSPYREKSAYSPVVTKNSVQVPVKKHLDSDIRKMSMKKERNKSPPRGQPKVYPPPSEKRYTSIKPRNYRSPSRESHHRYSKERRSRDGSRSPDRRMERYKPYNYNDRRGYRGRGAPRIFRSSRGRGFRGSPRGFRPRGSFRGYNPRGSYHNNNMSGRDMTPRRYSPNLWKHDMYPNKSPHNDRN